MCAAICQFLWKRQLKEADLIEMFKLIEKSERHISPTGFLRDLAGKDAVLAVRDEEGVLHGFTTQKVLDISCENKPVKGIILGDIVTDGRISALRDIWEDMVTRTFIKEDVCCKQEKKDFSCEQIVFLNQEKE